MIGTEKSADLYEMMTVLTGKLSNKINDTNE